MSIQNELIIDLARFSNDPYGFVLWAFPWGEAGSELSDEVGPEDWQVELLKAVRSGLLTLDEAIQIAVASGHGVGKSALVAWLILWAISTMEDTRGVVTANTEVQLRTKTWAELGKWYRLFLAKELFKLTATAIYSVDPAHERTWRIDMIPWSENNTEAFAGLHNRGKRIILVFDEGSAIPDSIFETAEGALTDKDTQILWAIFGNPTRNTGRFKDCFGKFAHRWKTFRVDSRTVRFSNKAQIASWIADYGEDSDFVRVRVLGLFPRAGTAQFIPGDLVEEAAMRELISSGFDAVIMGVDVARFGGDDTVLYVRRGSDARSVEPRRLQPANNQVPWSQIVASQIIEMSLELGVDMVFVDAGGVGAGVVDALRALNFDHIPVNFGGSADRAVRTGEPALYANKRAEMWGAMRDWLRSGCIPDDDRLKEQLTATEYGHNGKGEILLEKKEDLRKRAESPDIADALALTFAYPVMPKKLEKLLAFRGPPKLQIEYNPFESERLQA